MSLIAYALRMAKQYYKPETYNHALRVAQFVSENPMIPDEKMDNCIALAIMHDLKEDTNWNGGFGGEFKHFKECLDLISKPMSMDYIDYIKNIRRFSNINPEAYWVKLADMKDHLTQTETLTDKLRDKYLAALPYLL